MADREAFHSLADRRSCALHRAVAARLPEEPGSLERARARVDRWLEEPKEHPHAQAWKELLEGDLDQICTALGSTSEHMTTLRQASPFAGALDSRERWRILKHPDLRTP